MNGKTIAAIWRTWIFHADSYSDRSIEENCDLKRYENEASQLMRLRWCERYNERESPPLQASCFSDLNFIPPVTRVAAINLAALSIIRKSIAHN